MKPADLARLAESLGLGSKELAALLCVNSRALRGDRGLRTDSAAGILTRALERKLKDSHSAASVRALAIISARQGNGLEALLETLLSSYVSMDLLRLKG